MPPATQRNQGKRPGDLTGVRGQQLAAEAKRQKVTSAQQIADDLEADRLAKAALEVDYSTEARTKAREAAAAGVVEEGDVEVRPKTKRIRVNWPVDQMTFGREVISPEEYDEAGVVTKPAILGGLRTYDFEEGRWYTVDWDVYQHLAFLGYVYE
jgi:hypothetical protein